MIKEAIAKLTRTKKGKGKRRTIYLSRRAAGTVSEQPGCRRSGNSGEFSGGLLHILQRGVVLFAGADLDHAGHVVDKDLTVTDMGEDDVTKASATQMDAAVPVVREPVIHDGVYDTGMHKVSIIAKLAKFDQLKTALNDLGVTGMTVTQVMGCGIQKGTPEKYRGVPVDTTLLPKIKVEVIVSRISVDAVVEAAKKALYTGHIGDGKIFVYNVTRVVKIRTGEEDFAALQDLE